MSKRTISRSVTDQTLREALTARAELLRSSVSSRITDAPAHFSAAINDLVTPADTPVPDASPLPLVEPIWSFWMDAAHLASETTAFAAAQISSSTRRSSRRIPKLDLPPALIALLTSWFNDHHDGARAAAREANYLAHYGLRLPRTPMKSSPFLDAFHAVLLEVIRYEEAPGASDASFLMFLLRRLHIEMSRTASLIVEGVETSDVFARLGESLVLGRADLLTAQWLLSKPEITAALRSHILVPYPEQWMPPLDRLRQLSRTLDSLSLFYYDLAITSEALLLSIRFGNWTQSSPADATTWATFWRDDIARYLVAYQEVTNIHLAQ